MVKTKLYFDLNCTLLHFRVKIRELQPKWSRKNNLYQDQINTFIPARNYVMRISGIEEFHLSVSEEKLGFTNFTRIMACQVAFHLYENFNFIWIKILNYVLN